MRQTDADTMVRQTVRQTGRLKLVSRWNIVIDIETKGGSWKVITGTSDSVSFMIQL